MRSSITGEYVRVFNLNNVEKTNAKPHIVEYLEQNISVNCQLNIIQRLVYCNFYRVQYVGSAHAIMLIGREFLARSVHR